MEEQKHLLLRQDDDSVYKEEESQASQPTALAKRTSWSQTLSSTALLLTGLFAGLALSLYFHKRPCLSQYSTYSPAQPALRYVQQSIHPHGPKTYFGSPTLSQTKAWETLLEPVMIRASYDEMAHAGERPEDSIELLDGGYLASLGVYHDLHCLRRIRFFLYRDHFYPNMTAEQEHGEASHVEHCLESLRTSTMCTGDTGLWTFEWHPHVAKAQAKTAAQRSCVDWGALDEWTRGRAVGFNPRLKGRPVGMGL